jgi:ribosomal 50S subunit-recycling heat shock protein
MRLDKFLKVSRLIKRRTVAKDVSDQGRVLLNGKEAKPSTDVKIGDVLDIQFGQRTLTVRIERLTESNRKEDILGLYTVLKEEARKREEDPFGL